MNDSEKIVTVITPCYYSEHLLDTIDSVLKQNYPAIEYIITDDGTADFDREGIQEYVNTYAGTNIVEYKIIHYETNIGTTANINNAYKMARGEYLYVISGDDAFYDEAVISDWTREFEKTGADFITTMRESFDETMTESLGIQPIKREARILDKKNGIKLFKAMSAANLIMGCCTARSRASLDKWGYTDEQYRLIEDYPLYLKVLRNDGLILFWHRIAVKYRTNGGSSVVHVGDYYMSENDRIITNEVIPYVKHKRFYWNKYKRWLWKRKREKEFILCTMQPKRNKFLEWIKYPEKKLKRLIKRQ